MTEIEQRVTNLERQNRKLQSGLVAVVLVLVTAACVGAVVPQGISDVIEARLFRVVDESGATYVALSENGLRMRGTNKWDENGVGSPAIVLTAPTGIGMSGSSELSFNYRDGERTASLTVGGPVVFLDGGSFGPGITRAPPGSSATPS